MEVDAYDTTRVVKSATLNFSHAKIIRPLIVLQLHGREFFLHRGWMKLFPVWIGGEQRATGWCFCSISAPV